MKYTSEKNYQPYGTLWIKQMKRLSIDELETFLPRESPLRNQRVKKAQLINQLRSIMIVGKFNRDHPVDSQLQWLPVAKAGIVPIRVTVKSAAYVAASGEPVVFFKERSGYCSIEPRFLPW